MKWSLKWFSLILTFLFTLSIAQGNYYNGYVADGYSYYDGYWYKGNTPYYRTPYYYYQYGCRYQAYNYYPYYAPVTYKDPDWKTKLLEIAKQRDAFEGNLRKDALEHTVFLQSVKALGLEGNFHWQNYGQAVQYPYSYSYPPPLASTTYVNTQTTLADLYGNLDLNILYQQAGKLTQNAQQLAGQANGDFSALVNQAGSNYARAAEIIARGEAAAMALKSTESNSARIIQQSKSYAIEGNQGNQGNQGNRRVEKRTIAINHYCVKCHGGQKPVKDLDMTQYENFTQEQKDLIWGHLISNDPALLMPRETMDGPGKKLPGDVLELFSDGGS